MSSLKKKKTKMKSQEKLVLKPHHFLDIMKLYGAGISHFIPDLFYGHHFYHEANKILRQPDVPIALTTGTDDICAPCRFNKNSYCTDLMPNNSPVKSKDKWNKIVDRRLLANLNLQEGDEIMAIAFAALAQEKLTPQVISKIWEERPKGETENRIINLQKGLGKYLKKHPPRKTD